MVAYIEPSRIVHPVSGAGFQSLIISADSSADLLQASSWAMSNKLPFDSSHVPSEWGKLENPAGWKVIL